MKTVVSLKTEVLDEHIARRNLSRYQFARSAGISGGYFSQLMQRQKNPGQRARQKILAATQMAPNKAKLDFDQLFEVFLPPAPNQKAPDAAAAIEIPSKTPDIRR